MEILILFLKGLKIQRQPDTLRKNQRNVKNVDVSVHKHFRQLLKDLLEEFKFVFDDEDKKWVEALRTVTDTGKNQEQGGSACLDARIHRVCKNCPCSG